MCWSAPRAAASSRSQGRGSRLSRRGCSIPSGRRRWGWGWGCRCSCFQRLCLSCGGQGFYSDHCQGIDGLCHSGLGHSPELGGGQHGLRGKETDQRVVGASKENWAQTAG